MLSADPLACSEALGRVASKQRSQPHPELGEEVVAFVVLNAGANCSADELIEHCRERLAAFKYPRQIILLAELPRSSAGKVLKAQLATGAAS